VTPARPPADASREPAARCPICDGPVAAPAAHRPFCSARCRLIDLGRWLDGEYAVPGEPVASFGDPAREEAGDERDA